MRQQPLPSSAEHLDGLVVLSPLRPFAALLNGQVLGPALFRFSAPLQHGSSPAPARVSQLPPFEQHLVSLSQHPRCAGAGYHLLLHSARFSPLTPLAFRQPEQLKQLSL